MKPWIQAGERWTGFPILNFSAVNLCYEKNRTCLSRFMSWKSQPVNKVKKWKRDFWLKLLDLTGFKCQAELTRTNQNIIIFSFKKNLNNMILTGSRSHSSLTRASHLGILLEIHLKNPGPLVAFKRDLSSFDSLNTLPYKISCIRME